MLDFSLVSGCNTILRAYMISGYCGGALISCMWLLSAHASVCSFIVVRQSCNRPSKAVASLLCPENVVVIEICRAASVDGAAKS